MFLAFMSEAENNPLLHRGGLPLFQEIQASHVVPAMRAVLEKSEGRLRALEENPPAEWNGLRGPLEKIDHDIHMTWGPVNHLLGVRNSQELRDAYEEILPEVIAFSLRMSQSEPIYRAHEELKNGPAWAELGSAQKRIIEEYLRSCRHSGIGLEGKEKERFNEIANELSKLSTDFSNNVLDSTKAFGMVLEDKSEVEGLPESALRLAAQSYNENNKTDKATAEAGPWRITLDYPSYLPFMQHAKRGDLREKLYRAFIARASSGDWDNLPLINRILKLRRETAGLLGYKTYAEVSLAEKMADSVEEVDALMQKLLDASMAAGKRDLKDLREIAAAKGVTGEIMNWDVAYWAERLREERYQYTDEELRPYFPLSRVLDGLFGLAERLFDVKVTAADGQAPVWHKDVRYFRITDSAGGEVASFYLDPYSRPENKRGGAWMDTCMNRRADAEFTQLPVAYLVCNGTPPVGDTPSLLTFSEVETLFHEFGHGLQHMLTTVDYTDAAGINGVEWDAVELPSQFMENWCYHRPTLMGLTKHVETGETLPDELFEKIRAARVFRAGSNMLRQLKFAMLDLELHHRYDPESGEGVFAVEKTYRCPDIAHAVPARGSFSMFVFAHLRGRILGRVLLL